MYRACLLLQIVEDLSQCKIAEILEIPVKSVSTYVKRGLKQLSSAYQCLENELDVPVRRGFVQ
jgi:DNA-directed RNA polymerase specialized sigma24 family protein